MMGPALHAMARVWVEEKPDIACLQATHHSHLEHVQSLKRVLSEAGHHLHVASWQVVAHSVSSSVSAGTSILGSSTLPMSTDLVG